MVESQGRLPHVNDRRRSFLLEANRRSRDEPERREFDQTYLFLRNDVDDSGLLADRQLDIELTEAAKTHLAKDGYDPAFGARPLKRVIQRQVQDPLALKLLQGEFGEGDRVRVDVQDGHLTFERLAGTAQNA